MTAASIEVVDGVQQLLESEGILQSIRAQLRASVLNALATSGVERKASKAVQFLSKDTGKESILCVFDLLTALNLKETLSVLEAEIGITNSSPKTQTEIDNLRLKLSINSNMNEPIICHLLTTRNESGNQISEPSADISITDSPSKGAKKSLIPVIMKKSSPETVLSFPSTQSNETGNEDVEEDYVKVTEPLQYDLNSSINESKDDNDNSFAEEEKLSEYSSNKDINVKDNDDLIDKNIYNTSNNDKSEEVENEEKDRESFEEGPEDEDNIDDKVEDAADSDSSVSFSANYGYVDEDDSEYKISKNKEETPVTGNKNQPDVDESFENSSDMNTKKEQIMEDTESGKKNDDNDIIDEDDNVGVQRLKQNSISRSKQGWDVDTKDDEDDFMFSEEGKQEIEHTSAEKKTKSTTRESIFRATKNIQGVTDNDFEETLDLHEDKLSKSDFPGGSRSSWGAELANSNKSAMGDNDDELSEDNSVESMVESMADTDDEEDRDNKGGKSNNQEEDEEKKNTGYTGGSLFTSRNKSDLPQSKDISNSNLSYDNDGNSEEFDADADYSKDEGTYLSSQSGQLSEVEKKIADMERENSDLVNLRLGEEEKKNAQIDNSISNGAEDYSDGEFEQSEEAVSVASESIASDDIEAMELSVGGAGSDSDGSFSGLNSESSNKMNKNDIGTKSTWGKSSSANNDKKNNLEDSDASISVSDSADVSLSINETEDSKAFDADGYDLTTKANPPSGKRSSGW